MKREREKERCADTVVDVVVTGGVGAGEDARTLLLLMFM